MDEKLKSTCFPGANLSRADLGGANLSRADLSRANLRDANLSDANLSRANLRDANLSGADLRDANLRGADLRDANLRGADLTGANIDFSCWPLWCGSIGVNVDVKIARQLMYHACAVICDDEEFLAVRSTALEFANKFHRVGEIAKLEDKK